MTKYVQDFKLEKTIGCGTFGKVKRAKHIPTGELAAIKILQKDKIVTKKDMQRVQRQMDILKKVSHPNILQLYQLEQSTKNYYIVTELVEGEELFQKINRLGKLSEELAATYFLQILDTLLYLQSKGICHRDIKPENIIVKDDSLKLIDFGLSNYCQKGEVLYTSCGSPCYAAPEMMNQKQYDPEKTEIWALGITLYAMLTGKLPFQHNNTTKLYKIMATNEYEEVKDISSSLKSLIRAMIQVNPSLRIGLQQIKQHTWIRFQKHQFYQPKNQIQWNDKILQEMCENKKKSQAEMKQQILENYGKQSSYYYMASKKQLSLKKQQEFAFHDGPIHLNFIFPNITAVKTQVQKTMPTARWTSSSNALTATESITVKKIFGSTMYYLSITSNK